MWDRLEVTEVFSEANRVAVGRTVDDLARERGATPLEVALDLVVADRLRTCLIMHDVFRSDQVGKEAFDKMVKSPHVVFGGTDAGAHYDMLANEGLPIRTLMKRVRDEGSLTLEEVVRGFTAVAPESIAAEGPRTTRARDGS